MEKGTSRRTLLKSLGAAGALAVGGAAGAITRPSAAYAAGDCDCSSAFSCDECCSQWHLKCVNACGTAECRQKCNAWLLECEDCCSGGIPWRECCPGTVANLKSILVNYANALVVAAEEGYGGSDQRYGMLRARTGANSIGPWEQLDILELGTGTGSSSLYALRASNGLYVSAELGYSGNLNGMLRARASSIGPWEQFSLFYGGGDAHGSYSLRAANGLWVSAEVGYATSDPLYGMLRARVDKIGPWERFSWQPHN